MPDNPFPPGSFHKQDESPDTLFYAQPRLVNHIDEFAIGAVGEAYRDFLPSNGDYLDLMSSWVSHLPPDMPVKSLIGHGMNEVELQNNPRLSSYFLQDLNADPVLPLNDEQFDGVVICVSVQYLTRPVEVFREIGRVLKPDCPLVVAYSNRCFPTKAVMVWQYLNDSEHADLIGTYVAEAGCFGPAEAFDYSPAVTGHGLPDDARTRALVEAGQLRVDPLYVVVARKTAGSSPARFP
jgi:SAM-dependent methyltransferase